MMRAKSILKNKHRQLQWMRYTEVFLLSLGTAILLYLVTSTMVFALLGFGLTAVVLALLKKPWQFDMTQLCSYIDNSLPSLEHSSALLLRPTKNLSLLSKIQQAKVAEKIAVEHQNIRFKNNLVTYTLVTVGLVGIGFLLRSSGISGFNTPKESRLPTENIIQFQSLDALTSKVEPPKIVSQRLLVRYPKYTKKPVATSTKMDAKVLEGSTVSWQLQFDKAVDSVLLQFGDETKQLKKQNGTYGHSLKISSATIYNFKYTDGHGNHYLSDLYALEMEKDQPPRIEIKGLAQFSSFRFDDQKELNFTTTVSDDFGIADAAIIATVSKGSGESVKFREERLRFDNVVVPNGKQQVLKKRLVLDDLKMDVGDELYFYVETKDYKTPKPNVSRTETYFSVIKDTVSDAFAVEGTMGADLMPEYFRSQRQLIIDTEKLIADKPQLPKEEFNFTSNELGFDQKALRIKYGEFMGDESEMVSSEIVQEDDHEQGNSLDDYTHDHDGSNEHNLVADEDQDHDHGAEDGVDEDEDPLEAYVHNHEDPEASTLFAKSLKGKLKAAMSEMWDAELYLRLFQPEKSLPYQYRALKLIQEIKNSARIYVHRIGFDPPPIKESARLSGELDEIANVSRQDYIADEKRYPELKKAAALIEKFLEQGQAKNTHQGLFEKAGMELAALAIQEPSKHLETLQQLKWLSQAETMPQIRLQLVLRGILRALPNENPSPSLRITNENELNELFLQQLKSDGE